MDTPAPQAEYRLLTMADFERAAEVNARAFASEPPWTLLFPDPAVGERMSRRMFRIMITIAIANRTIYGVGSPVAATALWTLPNQPSRNLTGLLRLDTLRLIFSPAMVTAMFRLGGLFGQIGRMHKQYAVGPHYYLNLLAVHPNSQGQGLASKLVRPFLARADVEGLGAYLETMTPENVPLYEHYGFQMMECFDHRRSGVKVWSFWRLPQGASAG